MEIPGITFPMLGDFELNFLPYFTVFGWKIYWYGVIIAVGFLLAVIYAVKHAPQFGMSEDDVIDTLIWAVPLGIVCARLYYVIFYRDGSGVNPYFDGFNDLRDIIAVWEGGLAIYGGVIGGVVGLVIATRLKKISSRAMLDVVSFGLLIGQAIGRWGNFTNREAHGTETTVPWRMGLAYSYKTFYYHPTFLYESLWNIIGFLILHFWSKKHRKYDGQVFLCYLAWYGLGRLFIEGLRTDSLYVGSTNLRVSQLLAGLTCLLAVAVMLYIKVFRHPEPENLWVNRDRKEAAAEAPAPAPEAAEIMSEERFDEELSDAFRILRGEGAAEADNAGESDGEPDAEEEENSSEAPESSGSDVAGETANDAPAEAGKEAAAPEAETGTEGADLDTEAAAEAAEEAEIDPGPEEGGETPQDGNTPEDEANTTI